MPLFNDFLGHGFRLIGKVVNARFGNFGELGAFRVWMIDWILSLFFFLKEIDWILSICFFVEIFLGKDLFD